MYWLPDITAINAKKTVTPKRGVLTWDRSDLTLPKQGVTPYPQPIQTVIQV